MKNKFVYRVENDNFVVSISSGAWCLYKGDLLFFENLGETFDGFTSNVNKDTKMLTRIYYKDFNFCDDNSKMCWLNNLGVINARFSDDLKYYNLSVILKMGILTDITTQWERDNKLELIGI